MVVIFVLLLVYASAKYTTCNIKPSEDIKWNFCTKFAIPPDARARWTIDFEIETDQEVEANAAFTILRYSQSDWNNHIAPIIDDDEMNSCETLSQYATHT